jgi:hypothetical protein
MNIINLDNYRNGDSVLSFAKELGLPPEIVLEHLKLAGINVKETSARLCPEDKTKLLSFLRGEHSTSIKREVKVRKLIRREKVIRRDGLFVLITFDLKYAESKTYKLIIEQLKLRGIRRTIFKKDNTSVPLPSNIFVVQCEKDQYASPNEACESISEVLKLIFDSLEVRGKYFITAASGWAWRTGGK